MGESSNSEREARILEAASELITQYGYDKTTVEEIAQAAGVSKGAIYLHFKSKEDLFEALLTRDSYMAVKRFYEMIDADPDGVTLFNIYRYALVVTGELPLLKALYLRDRRVMGDYMRRTRALPEASSMFLFNAEFVRQYQQAGLLRDDLDPGVISYLLLALVSGVFMMDTTYSPEEPPSITALGEVMAEMLAHGLEPRETQNGNQAEGRKALDQLTDAKIDFIERLRSMRKQL